MMAPIEIEAPDGSIVEFPEGTPRETIKAAMAKRYPANKWKNNLRQPQRVVRSDTGEELDPRLPTTMALRQLAAAGGIDETAPVGDRRNPRVVLDDDANVEGLDPNSFYIDKQGRVLQAPVRSQNVGKAQFGDGDAAFYLNNKGAKQFQYTLNPSEKSRVDWIAKNYPGAEFARDEKGALVVRPRTGDGWMYLNKPGLDINDAVDFGNQALLYSPAGAAAKPGAALGTNALRVGTASAGISATQDVVTGQPIDPGKAALAAGGGALGEYVGPMVGAVGNVLAKAPGRTVNALAGRASGDVQSTLRNAGNALGDDFAARAAQNPNQTGIPMSRGQQSGDFDQIAFEQAALRGARGEEAGEIMRGFAGNQAAAVRNTGRGLAGRETVNNINEAGAVVQQGLRDRAVTAKGAVGEAYDAIKESDAVVSAPTVSALPGRIKAKLEEEFFSPEVMTSLNPRTTAIFNEIEKLAKSAPDAEATMPIAGIERVRQGIVQARKAAQGNDAQALDIAKREFDSWLDDAIDNALIKGDPATIGQLKRARGLYADYRRLYGGGRKDEGAQKIVARLIESGSNEADAVNLLFGRAKLDGSGTAVQALKNIKEIVGDGPELSALKEGAVLRLMSRMSRNEGGGVGNINYKALADDWTEALDRSGAPLMRELFTPQEIGEMRRFVATLRRLTPPEGSVNRSGSGYEVARAVGNAAGVLGGKLKIVMPFAKRFDDAANVNRARAATSGRPAPVPLPRNRVTGVLGAASGNILGGPRPSFVSPPPE